MSLFPLQPSQVNGAADAVGAEQPERSDALTRLAELDAYRTPPTGMAILCFFVSAGFAVLAFLLVNEAALAGGLSRPFAMSLVSTTWVLIFPLWALTFLAILSSLSLLGSRISGQPSDGP